MREIILKENYGTAKKGDVFIVGLYDVPDYYKGKLERDDFCWEKGRRRDENCWIIVKELLTPNGIKE